MTPTLTFGEVLTIIIIIVGIVGQYLGFSSRMSKFEGYTKAKIEAMEREMNNFWLFFRNHVNGEMKNGKVVWRKEGP